MKNYVPTRRLGDVVHCTLRAVRCTLHPRLGLLYLLPMHNWSNIWVCMVNKTETRHCAQLYNTIQYKKVVFDARPHKQNADV